MRCHQTYKNSMSTTKGRSQNNMAQMTMIQAITNAMATELQNDEDELVIGEDIGGYGGVFCETEGLLEDFGVGSVFGSALADSAIVSLGLGLSLEIYRSVV